MSSPGSRRVANDRETIDFYSSRYASLLSSGTSVMMADHFSPDVREQLRQLQRELEARRKRDEERERELETRRKRDEERERELKARRKRDEERERELKARQKRDEERERELKELQITNRQSTLFEYLDLCHLYLHNNFKVQPNPIFTTQGSAANAIRKCRPNAIRHWDSFLAEQSKIWERVMKSGIFSEERLFPEKAFLTRTGETLGKKLRGSELDLHLYLESAVHEPIKNIMNAIFDDRMLQMEFDLIGSVDFENHANTLTPDGISAPLTRLEISTKEEEQSVLDRTRKIRQSQEQRKESSSVDLQPRADQFCVYQNGDSKRRPLLVCEYKPAHKLSLNSMKAGLEGSSVDIDVDDIVCVLETEESSTRVMRRLVAAVITQAFSYMITAGLEFGCVCTGEVTIFLQVREDQPETVYYYLSIPTEEVGETTGWLSDTAAADQEETRLHLTAVGQMIAFILRARESRVREMRWRQRAMSKLDVWSLRIEEVLSVLREKLESPEKAISEYHPSPKYERAKDVRSTPIRRVQPPRRARRGSKTSCNSVRGQDRQGDDRDEGDETTGYKSHYPAPSGRGQANIGRRRAPSDQGASSGHQGEDSIDHDSSAQYCSQDCILGLRDGSELDRRCPNVQFHGSETHHTINSQILLKLLRDQFAENPDLGCEAVGRPGARGVLFRLQLMSLRYVIAAKGCPIWFEDHLRHESLVYKQLWPIQGRHVPVQLGILSLQVPFIFEGIAEITQMLCLSFSGISLVKQIPDDDSLSEKVKHSIQAVHSQGVLQNDAEARNLLWQDDRVMIIDFERAKFLETRTPLGVLSLNRKRTRDIDIGGKDVPDDRCRRELAQALAHVRQSRARA